ncbi:MAG: hypothetical protein ACREA2_07450 [Blastocatellia bacterium]
MNYFLIAAALMAGFLTKFVDLEEHGLKIKRLVIYLAGALYGFVIAYAMKLEPSVAPLVLGTILGVILTGKIDSKGHLSGITSFILFTAIWGIPKANFLYLLILLLTAIVEEFVNTWMLDNGKIKNKTLRAFLEVRPLLEIVAFSLSFLTGLWPIWHMLFFFDLAYNLTNKSFYAVSRREVSG